jgi:hypothetical protein
MTPTIIDKFVDGVRDIVTHNVVFYNTPCSHIVLNERLGQENYIVRDMGGGEIYVENIRRESHA